MRSVDELAKEALALSPELRALLADRIVESLVEPGSVDVEWHQEALRRRDEVRSGRVKTIPGEEALARVRRLVGL
jgi:putative addiction module component (TIGR02574 family)